MMRKYRVYFKIGAKKLRMDVFAISKEDARHKVMDSFKILKTDYLGEDTPDVVKDIFSHFK